MANQLAFGSSGSNLGETVSEFMGLRLLDADRTYLHLRRERQFVAQLSKWIVAEESFDAHVEAWESLITEIPALEDSLAKANAGLPEGVRVKENPARVKLLVRGAVAAAKGRDFGPEEALSDFLGLLVFSEVDEQRSWATVAFHSFRGTPIVGSAVVPVAFDLAGTGVLARLEVEVFDSGPNVTANHAEQILEHDFLPAFTESIEKAFAVASEETGKELCGRWRVLPWSPDLPLPDVPIDGPSVGAAAARAWSRALSKQKTDQRVLVITKMGDRKVIEALNEPEGVAAKVKAVCEVMRKADPMSQDAIDTIVVVGHRDTKAAEDALSEDMLGRIRIEQLDNPKREKPRHEAAA